MTLDVRDVHIGEDIVVDGDVAAFSADGGQGAIIMRHSSSGWRQEAMIKPDAVGYNSVGYRVALSGPFVNTFGKLDIDGKNTATIAPPADLLPLLVGTQVTHTVLIFESSLQPTCVSPAFEALFTP